MTASKDNYYVSDVLLTYELILSQGIGFATNKLCNMLYLITDGILKKFTIQENDLMDIRQDILLVLLRTGYSNFNYKRYGKSFAYMSEICKRKTIERIDVYKMKKNHISIDYLSVRDKD